MRWSSLVLSVHLASRGWPEGPHRRGWELDREDAEASRVVRMCSCCMGALLHLPGRLPRPPRWGTALVLREHAVPLLANIKALAAL